MNGAAEQRQELDALSQEIGLEALQSSSEFRGPVEPPDGHDCNGHVAHVYETFDEKLEAAAPFVRHGLEQGERVVFVVDDGNGPAVRAGLRSAGVDVDAALDELLTFHTVGETYFRTGSFDPDQMVEFYDETIAGATESYEGLRIVAEASWPAEDPDATERFLEYEARINDCFADEDCLAICQYDRQQFPPSVLRDVIRAHPHLIFDGTVSHNVYYTPPAEFVGPDDPAHEVERMLGTLRDRTDAKAELQHRERSLRRCYEITSDPDRSFDAKLDALCDLVCEQFDLDLGGVARVDPETDSLEVERVNDEHDHVVPGAQIALSETYCRATATGEAATTGADPVAVTDPVGDGFGSITLYEEFGVETYLGTYLEIEGDVDRTFWFVSNESREEPITDTERTLVDLMGQWVRHELNRRQHEQYLREAYEITSDPTLDFAEKLERLLELARERVELDAAGLTHLPSWDGEFYNEFVVGDGNYADDAHQWTDPSEGCFCGEAITASEPVGMADVRGTDWEDDEIHRGHGLSSYLGTKVTNGSAAYGTVWVGSTEPREREFSESEHTFLRLVGQWISYEIERRGHNESQQELYDVTSDPELEFEAKLERLLEFGCDTFGLEMGGLNHLPTWDGEFRLEKGVGLGLDPDEELWTDPGNDCYCRHTVTQSGPVGVADVHDTDWTEDTIYQEFGIASYLGTKVSTGAEPYGTLWFGSTEPRESQFSEAERSFVELLGQWISYEIERREHHESQRELYEIAADADLGTDEKIQRLLEAGSNRLNLSVGLLTRERDGAFEIEHLCGAHQDLEEGTHLDLEEGPLTPPGAENDARQLVDTGDSIGVGDAGAGDSTDASLSREFGVECYAGTQVTVRGDAYGTVCFTDTSPRTEFTDAEHSFLDLMSQCIGYELERRQREADLEETIDRLEQSNDRLKQFAYAASHDLQEPLRMVSSYLQLLESRHGDDLDEEASEYIEFAVDGADRMRSMVEDLLAYSQVEQADSEFEPVDCDAVLDRVTADLQIQIEENDAEVTVESLPTLRGDADQLEQLFGNLVSNAIKYNESDPPRVEIEAQRRADWWTFTVADNGIGIEQDSTDRVFEVFQRLHNDDEYSGTGVGLSLCQEIVENHGGTIDVESEPGAGSTFTFSLPATRDDER